MSGAIYTASELRDFARVGSDEIELTWAVKFAGQQGYRIEIPSGVLGFSKEFAVLVIVGLSGEPDGKLTTIRASNKHWKKGMLAHLWTGQRLKKDHPDHCKLGIVEITRVRPIELDLALSQVILDGSRLTESERGDLARGDGFDSIGKFWSYFSGNKNNRTYHGQLIEWGRS